ncbi:hypothetical protein NQ318_006218 [Aromia moschata]|uniref:Chitin-binding type-2 domain-containing protein n=1 Tax=Aromia moschata TaxID=1265417 RepID=A0AAV8XW38_9CUCU|nr:hypothetical protein NQ318_006218 [Aromia moschata]
MFLAAIILCYYLATGILVETEVSCPDEDPDEAEILADPTNCTRFYICDNGSPYLHNCSGGLFFNSQLNVCDQPANVVFCEYDDLLYLKPYCDCHKYVICDYGNMSVLECPKGYYFSAAEPRLRLGNSSDPCQQGDCG